MYRTTLTYILSRFLLYSEKKCITLHCKIAYMEYRHIFYDNIMADVMVSLFTAGSGTSECHAIINLRVDGRPFEQQLHDIYEAESRLRLEPGMEAMTPVMKRYFHSDVTNQKPLMKEEDSCACSSIQQPPLNGTKIGEWIYFVKEADVKKQGNTVLVEHNGYTHIWNLGMQCTEGGSYGQTRTLLESYEETLESLGANIAENCIRTWFYVRDVDFQYTPMVVARRENFEFQGLTKDTHFIASTGICGVPDSPKAIIQFGAYAIKGLESGQLQHIHGSSHLNPTHEYGVTFERGTAIHYGDRDHVIISGTASINNKGEVMHVGDVKKQTLRMWENVGVLLEEAGATYDDVMHLIVYLRDISDYPTVKPMFEERFPDIPKIFTLAPVCRPQWLIEMECVAITKAENKGFKDF